jgi:hypothetical protein
LSSQWALFPSTSLPFKYVATEELNAIEPSSQVSIISYKSFTTTVLNFEKSKVFKLSVLIKYYPQ